METYEIYEMLCGMVGYDTLAEEIYRWFGDWKMDVCLRDIANTWGIEIDDEEDEEHEDDE